MKPRRTSHAGRAWIALSGSLMLILLAGCTPAAPSASTSPPTPIQTTATPATAATSSPSASPIDTTNWTVYESKQYGFSIKHPPGWLVEPADRDWTLEADAGQPGFGGREEFVTPAHDLYVAVWSAPANDTPETPEGIATWVEQYCKLGGHSCSGLDRSLPLCNGIDCDPGLLVTDDSDFVEAFFTGGKHQGRIVAVEVGLPEWAEPVAEFGGARRLLEGFLSGMGVCPAQPDQSQPGCP
jgi:hypothetical protein